MTVGEKLPFGGALFLHDGTKLCEVEEIPVFSEPYDPENPPPPMPFFDADREITGTLVIHPTQMRRLRRTLWRWTAKGPLRWRAVLKAEKMRGDQILWAAIVTTRR